MAKARRRKRYVRKRKNRTSRRRRGRGFASFLKKGGQFLLKHAAPTLRNVAQAALEGGSQEAKRQLRRSVMGSKQNANRKPRRGGRRRKKGGGLIGTALKALLSI